MKRRAAALTVAGSILLLGMTASAYEPGTYTGTAEGKNGPVTVNVEVDSESILSVEVTEHAESQGICEPAIEQIPAAIVENQSLSVDTVTGATITSQAILDAAEDALTQAGADAEALKETPEAADAALTPGIYTSTKRGFAGYVTVYVTVDEDSIQDVTVAKCTDMPVNIQAAAIAEIPGRIVETQSTQVDAVCGATFTSNGIKAAVEDCLQQAGNAAKFAVPMPETVLEQGEDETVDILVLGGGGSGCMAALYAQNEDLTGEDTGLSVMVVEKQAFLGGSVMESGGYIGAAAPLGDPTNLDNPEMMAAYVAENQEESGLVNEALLEEVARVSNTGVLAMQQLGMPLMTADSMRPADTYDSLITWSLLAHPFEDPTPDGWQQSGDEIGRWFTRHLAQTAVDVRMNTTADELLVEDGAVVGAVVHDREKTYNVYAKKVIDACGSFISDPEMFSEHYPDVAGSPIYANGGNTGDGLRMVTEKFGVEPVTGRLMAGYFGTDLRFGIDTDLRYSFFDGSRSMFLVNKNGERFIYDGSGYDTWAMHEAIVAQDGKVGYVIVGASDDRTEVVENSRTSDHVVKCDTLEEIAAEFGIDAEQLAKTAEDYQKAAAGEAEDAFGVAAEDMVPLDGPYYAFPMYSVQTATFSGFVVGDHCEILDTEGQPIPNLYGVGETALGMAGVNQAMFSGAIAGKDAVRSILGE